ncbi:hypothetical protein C3B51_15640 [Pseudoalteromonas rubra]|uniref:Uncharacterized protein n=1 Tax=Pseudoalteromonas rubra TaxID=43658 RepID=A0A4V2E2E6_9GAMM|nr:hypothetical protein [Pseudoalteromonas rubra]RZM78104.1 hypothetical protein C3B51_15640 [Pseudoalteromonas rubra]
MGRVQALLLALVLGGLGYALWTLYTLPSLRVNPEQAQQDRLQTRPVESVTAASDVALPAVNATPPETTVDTPNLSSVAQSQEVGDDAPYIPPISPATPAPAYEGDLSDHQAYLADQSARAAQMKLAYIAAVDKKVERLEALLEKGMRHKLPPQQLQEARDKIQGLRVMQAQLRRELAQ